MKTDRERSVDRIHLCADHFAVAVRFSRRRWLLIQDGAEAIDMDHA